MKHNVKFARSMCSFLIFGPLYLLIDTIDIQPKVHTDNSVVGSLRIYSLSSMNDKAQPTNA